MKKARGAAGAPGQWICFTGGPQRIPCAAGLLFLFGLPGTAFLPRLAGETCRPQSWIQNMKKEVVLANHFFEIGKGKPYLISIFAPTSANLALICSASSLLTASFRVLGADDGREKCKEWFRLRPKPPRPRGKATRYDCSQRDCGPSDTSLGTLLMI